MVATKTSGQVAVSGTNVRYDMGSKQVRTEGLVDGQAISKYLLVGCTVDSAVARKSLFYHYNNKTA